MKPVRALLAFRLVYVLFIVVASAETVAAGLRRADPQHDPVHMVALGSAEILGALLFLWRITQAAGAAILLLVYAIAAILTLSAGEDPIRFLFFAATALFIVHLDRNGPSQGRSAQGV